MPADKLLASIRDAQRQLDALAEAPDDDPRVLDLLTAIAHDISDLDAYLTNGGTLPEQWRGTPHPTASRRETEAMTIYAVDARRIDDRPDPQGWYSSGIGLPTFYVAATDPDRALEVAHDITGNGSTDVTRTLVSLIAYNPATDGRIGEVHHSVRTWNGWQPADQPGFPYLRDVAKDLAAEPVTVTLDGVTVNLHRAGVDQHLSVLIDTADADLPDDPAVGPLGLLVTLNDADLYDTTDREVSRS